LGKAVGKDRRIRCLDHYRARVHAQLNYRQFLRQVTEHLGALAVFRFYFLENRSGTDAIYCEKLRSRGWKERNGPIENEQRKDGVKHGLVLDMLPHMPAVLAYLGNADYVNLRWIQAARYLGVDYKDDEPTEISHETFAAMGFDFLAFDSVDHNQRTHGEAYVGKGIRGIQADTSMDNNVKLVELEGTNGNRIHLDLRGKTPSAYLLNKNGGREKLFELEQDPYHYLFRKIFKDETGVIDLTLPLRTGKRILDIVGDVRRVLAHQNPLGTYLLGNKQGRQPPYLEELCKQLPVIWGSKKST
jgi:hypothetical protein